MNQGSDRERAQDQNGAITKVEESQGSTEQIKLIRFIAKEEENRYIELPFHLPSGMEEIRVRYSYGGDTHQEPNEERAVVDMGIRDMHRVRGWSGGARDSFVIGLSHATPGYLSGSLDEGEWAVLLGAHRIPTGGATVTVEVTFVRERYRWLKGDLHSHTHHSDGAHSIAEAVGLAKEAGLDFLAFTDHNTVSQNRAIPSDPDLLLIPGMELTTDFGHANLLGAFDPLTDFRVRSDEELLKKVAIAKEKGAKVVLNHPYDGDCGWRWSWQVPFDWVEIWNGPWRKGNEEALHWWQEALSGGRRLVAVGGSDYHRPHPYARYGMPTNWVYAKNRSIAAILSAIDAGHLFLSVLPQGPILQMRIGEAMMGDTVLRTERMEPVKLSLSGLKRGDRIRLLSNRGVEREFDFGADGEGEGDSLAFQWKVTTETFLRVEIWRLFPEVGLTLPAAIGNPIYFREES